MRLCAREIVDRVDTNLSTTTVSRFGVSTQPRSRTLFVARTRYVKIDLSVITIHQPLERSALREIVNSS